MKAFVALVLFLIALEVRMEGRGGVMNYDETREYVTKCNDSPTMFAEKDHIYFNCTLYSGKVGESMFCTDDPCDLWGNSCNWQVVPGTEIHLTPGSMNYLYQCKLCPSYNCGNKYAYAKQGECGPGGVFKTSNNGRSWYCENKLCKGIMKERSDKPGFYYCEDSKCWGTGKLDEMYHCQDPTCVANDGYLKWSDDQQKWDCDSSSCINADSRMTQKNDGWVCESPSCPGKMIKPTDSLIYMCVDPNCKGRIVYGSDRHYFCKEDVNYVLYAVIGGIAVIVLAVFWKLRNDRKIAEEKLKMTSAVNSFGYPQVPQVHANYQAPQYYTA